ncbi:hypothetical protein [Bosea sp. AS-1]|uniref:hypothetical protein n=1 Tax=Bosea sp. AS-1 TaxID=2015316 RepID=UPI000B76D279|nr:hypothetical protein [Bosea sp. AS-1]
MTERDPIVTPHEQAVPNLALTHGQVIQLMSELGLRQGVSATTFNYYIKSLRKLGIPFEKGKGQSEGHRHITYDFEELMELAMTLLLRVYGTLPDPVVAGIRGCRSELRPIFRRAYFDRSKRAYPAARISAPRRRPMILEGVFVDLNIRYAAGRMVEFGPPRALSPFEALGLYARSGLPARSYMPLNLSCLADQIIERGRALPPIRRGRGKRSMSP